jgi:MFS family permease
MFQALKVRDFRLLWAGGLVSSVGTWLLTIAVPAHVLLASGSLRDTGLTLVAEYLPQLVLGPFAGVAADRWDRRRLMIGANAACAAAVAVMLVGIPPGRYWVIYLALVAETSFGLVNAPAAQALIPEIIGTGTVLSSANSLSAATSGVVRLIGGPLGGALVAVLGIRWLICADVLSYLLAAFAVAMTARPGTGTASRHSGNAEPQDEAQDEATRSSSSDSDPSPRGPRLRAAVCQRLRSNPGRPAASARAASQARSPSLYDGA